MHRMEPRSRLNRLLEDARTLLGYTPPTSNYEDRLKLQKIAYLLQKSGVDYGYTYVWHYAGPFSFDLHFEYYDSQQYAVPDERKTNPEPLENFKRRFGRRLSDADELEMLASILYLEDDRGLKMEPDKIVYVMGLNKPKFSENEVRSGISFLKETFGLVSS